MQSRKTIPAQAGIGLRSPHHEEILQTSPNIPWLEVHTENYFAEGGETISFLEKISSRYPMSFHGVSLSLGSADGLSKEYLKKLKQVVDRFNPGLVSEHLSWTSYNGIYTHDLLPLPYNKESLDLLANHIDEVQQYLGRHISIENPSTYLSFHSSIMPEDEFLNRLAYKANCGILLDVNNIYVSSANNKLDPAKHLVEKDFITEIHLAGHSNIKMSTGENMIIDTHSDFVIPEVWDLYERTIKRVGAKPTLIEWDENIPELEDLLSESRKAQNIIEKNVTERITERIS
jgi:uncharacterized protein (UPF0276 family)